MNEGKKGFKEIKHPVKPRNPVAKNARAAIGGGAAGAHKDKKKAAKQGEVKHKKPADMSENIEYSRKLNLLFKIAVLKDQISEGLRDPKDNPCWKGYKPVGTKKKNGKTVPNCVPKESVEEEKQKGVDGKACWDGYKRMGTKKKGGRTVDNCVKVGEDSVDESGLQYYTGVKKHGKEYMVKAAQAARKGASQKELGALKDKYSKAYKESQVDEYEQHRYKDSQGNVWVIDDEGNKELVQAAPGSSSSARYGSRYPRRSSPMQSSGMYFYNVKPGQENDAMKAGLKQTKSGKWYSRFSSPTADKLFGAGRFWQPKNEGIAEGFGSYYYEQLAQKVFDLNPNLDTSGRANELLNAGYKLAVDDLGRKRASHFFSYDEDFPSDFVSAYSYLKKGKTEDVNPEYDDEAGMADNNLETLKRAVEGLDNLIGSGDNLPEWCQEKIAVAKSMLVTVWDYMESEKSS